MTEESDESDEDRRAPDFPPLDDFADDDDSYTPISSATAHGLNLL